MLSNANILIFIPPIDIHSTTIKYITESILNIISQNARKCWDGLIRGLQKSSCFGVFFFSQKDVVGGNAAAWMPVFQIKEEIV